jgi:hypothetical protein
MPKPPEPARDAVLPDQFLDGDMSAATIIEVLQGLKFPTVHRHRSSRTVSIDYAACEYIVTALRARARRP